MKLRPLNHAARAALRLNAGLSQRRRLAYSVVYNLLGQGIPLLAALYAIPVMIFALGDDRFGIYTLIWVVAGYFGLFDLGIGRAITKLVSEKIGSQQMGEVPAIFWTALAVVMLSGLIGAFLLFAGAPLLTDYLLNTSNALREEALPAFRLLAVCLPVVICAATLNGFLEALHRFDTVNLIRIPAGVFSFIGPLLGLPYSHDLSALTAILLTGRIVEFAALLTSCLAAFPALRVGCQFNRQTVRPLLSFGGWITVSNIIGPVLTYLDRLFISALISVAAITYYATPYSLTIKLVIIPTALVGVLFPILVRRLLEDRTRAAQLFHRSSRYVIYATFPVVLMLFTFAHQGLAFWVNESFARHSTAVVQWLLLGIFINGLAQIPVALIHGSGKPALVAKLHLAELPLYLAALLALLNTYGIVGVAMAGAGRMAVDAIALFWLSRRLLPEAVPAIRQTLLFTLLAACALLVDARIETLLSKMLYCLAALAVFLSWSWRTLQADERSLALRLANTLTGRKRGGPAKLDSPLSGSLAHPTPRMIRQTEEQAHEKDEKESHTWIQGQGGLGRDQGR